MVPVQRFTSFKTKNLCVRVLGLFVSWWLAEKQTCPLVSQNKGPESAIKSPFNSTLLPVKKYGTNYQRDYVLMVTAVVEIRTAQLGAIRVRKKTDSFISLRFFFFIMFSLAWMLGNEVLQIESDRRQTSICSGFKKDSCPPFGDRATNRPSWHALTHAGLYATVVISRRL